MSTLNHQVIAARLTHERLVSYLRSTGNDLPRAIALYDWNIGVGAAFHEDLSRLEVVFRNAVDSALETHGHARGWSSVWYQRQSLFPGRAGRRAWDEIDTARRRATRGNTAEVHGKVVAELTFGFWRFLCTPNYLTSLWVPALVNAFPNHPEAGEPRQVRADVEARMERLHFLRNRIAHHEPIHRRDLTVDHSDLLDIVGWICPDSRRWAASVTRTPVVIAERP